MGLEIEEMRSQSYYLDYPGVRLIALDVNVFANADFETTAKKRVWDGFWVQTLEINGIVAGGSAAAKIIRLRDAVVPAGGHPPRPAP